MSDFFGCYFLDNELLVFSIINMTPQAAKRDYSRFKYVVGRGSNDNDDDNDVYDKIARRTTWCYTVATLFIIINYSFDTNRYKL